MHHAPRVRIGQGVGHVVKDAPGVPQGQGAFALHAGAEGLALHVRHGEVEEVPGRPRGEQGHDVRMLQGRGQLGFATEPVGVDAGRQLGGEDLHHHPAGQPHLFGEIHAAHAAAPQLALEAVLAGERGFELGKEVLHKAVKDTPSDSCPDTTAAAAPASGEP